ncbi:UNVERIFIED_CONTAM: hypothetical protein FKN15_070183 [Acipenser sinensis]
MLRSCGLGETQQVALLFGVLEGIAKQEVMVLEEEERGTCAQIWRILDELYGDKAPGVKLRVDFFAAHQNRVLQGEGLKKDGTSHGPAYVGTNRGASSAHNVAGVATSAETASNRKPHVDVPLPEPVQQYDDMPALEGELEPMVPPMGPLRQSQRANLGFPVQLPGRAWWQYTEDRARSEGMVGTWERGEKREVKDWLKGSDQSFWVEVVIYLPVVQFLTAPFSLPRFLVAGSSGWWLISRERSSREQLSYRRRGVRLRTKRVGGGDPGSVGFTPGLFLSVSSHLCYVHDGCFMWTLFLWVFFSLSQ